MKAFGHLNVDHAPRGLWGKRDNTFYKSRRFRQRRETEYLITEATKDQPLCRHCNERLAPGDETDLVYFLGEGPCFVHLACAGSKGAA